MQNLSLRFLLLGLMVTIGFSSCFKSNDCDGDCVFSGKEIKAEVLYMNCFGQYGLVFEHPTEERGTIVGLPITMEKDYQEEGTKVIFDGGFFLNELSPDPNNRDIGIPMESIYQVDIWKISGRE